MPSLSDPNSPSSRTQALFSKDSIYKTDTICNPPIETPVSYNDILLKIRLDMVRRFANQAFVLDVCCATGHHLLSFANIMEYGVGIDFSLQYIQRANYNKADYHVKNIDFVYADAVNLSLPDNCIDVVYSFSSLYGIPDVGEVIYGIGRVLKQGGKAVFDLGNYYSLNEICCRYYPETAQVFYTSVPTMRQMIAEGGMRILEHRAFQILPLWAERPGWMKPLLLNFWTRFMAKKIGGKMLDEWLSNLPIIKNFAFRHVFVCEKM